MSSPMKRFLIIAGTLIAIAALLLGVGIVSMFGFRYPDVFVLHWVLTPSDLLDLPIDDRRDAVFSYEGSDGDNAVAHGVEFTTALAPETAKAKLEEYFLNKGYSPADRGHLVRELPGDSTWDRVGFGVESKPRDGRYVVYVSLLEIDHIY